MRLPPVRFTVRRLMVVVAAIALMIAGYLWVVRPHVVVVELAMPPQLANTDHDLFDIVLSDLIERSSFIPPIRGRGAEKRQIVFSNLTILRVGRYRWELNVYIDNKNIESEIRDDLLRRNPLGKCFIIARYHPSNPDILVRDLGQLYEAVGFSAQFPKAVAYVVANLPGYSRDGRTAVVPFVSVLASHDSANGYYVFAKVKGRWEIINRYIVYAH